MIKIDYRDYVEEAMDLYDNDPELTGNRTAVAKWLHHRDCLEETVSINAFRIGINYHINRKIANSEIILENVKLAKGKQSQQDKNRIERKAFREYAREENAVAALGTALLEQHKKFSKHLKTLHISPLIKNSLRRGVGVVQITDLHGNELIDLPHNKYDFEILAKRLKYYINECLFYFRAKKVEKICLLVTGDLLNSDRRLDELLNQATNRAKASLLMEHLLTQAILELRNTGLPLTIVSVLGNESRMGKEMTFSKYGLSDNYDFVIMANIKKTFEFAKIKGITWGTIDQVEETITIDGLKWLIAHDLSRFTDTQQKNQSAIGRYSLQGEQIDYMAAGHIHATKIGGNSSRSSSMTGSNSFNEIALNLAGKAQHNLFICQDKKITPIVVDLQNVDGVSGYHIIEELEAYNAKSVGKLHTKRTVFEIVV